MFTSKLIRTNCLPTEARTTLASIALILFCAKAADTRILAAETGFTWNELISNALNAVSTSSLSNSVLVFDYQRITIINNCTGCGQSLKQSQSNTSRDRWFGEFRVGTAGLYKMEKLDTAEPEIQPEAPRLPTRRGFSYFDNEYRTVTVFEELKSQEEPPSVLTHAEIKVGQDPVIDLPVVLTRQTYRDFLEKFSEMKVSRQSEQDPVSWLAEGMLKNRDEHGDVSLKFSEIDGNIFLYTVKIRLEKSGVDMMFNDWNSYQGYSLPGSVLIRRMDVDRDVTWREEFVFAQPPKTKEFRPALFNAEVPPFAQVLDHRLGELINYQAGKRLPNDAELRAILSDGARAKADYFRASMKPENASTIPTLVLAVLLLVVLSPIIFVIYNQFRLQRN